MLTYRQRYEALQAEAQRDALTGIHNRGFFDETLRVHVAGAKRVGTPVAVLLADIDHFKRVNDEHGHVEGDRTLRVIAEALTRAARASDIVCRYGGEEFGLILPGTSPEAAAQVAERIREEVPRACAAAKVAGGARITLTVGIGACPRDGADPDSLIVAADQRLYGGRAAGRDRVIAA